MFYSIRCFIFFIKNSCVSIALTKQPSTYYSKYLREFWYTTEAYSTINTITFTLSSFDKPLSFNLDDISTFIVLKPSGNYVSLPLKETVKAGLETLGLIDENDSTISSSDLANSSLLKMRYFSLIWKVLMQYIVKCLGGMQGSHDQLNVNQQIIAYCLCWGLDIDIINILFSDLLVQLNPSKKGRKPNICYTRYLSLIFEHLLKDNYNNENLKTFKPYHITASSLKTPSEYEVPLTSHMLKVVKISEDHYKYLFPPSGDVIADDTADKSSSRTSVQPVTQPKAKTDKKLRRKKVIASSEPNASKIFKESPPSPQVIDTQHAEEKVATVDTTHSLEAFESAEEQANQLETIDATKITVQKQIDEEIMKEFDIVEEEVKDYRITSLGNISLEKLLASHENKEADKEGKVVFDLANDDRVIDITLVVQDTTEADYDLESMPGDDIESLSGFKAEESDHNDDLRRKEINSLTSRVIKLESSLAQKVADKLEDFVPRLVADAFEERIPDLLSDTLKNILPRIIKDSVNQALPKFDKRVKKTLKDKVPDLILKPLNKELIALNKLENNRMIDLQRQLSTVIKVKVGHSIQQSVRKEIRELVILIGFSEWLEVHYLESKVKRKQVMDGMHRNLVPVSGVVPLEGEFHLATTPQLIRIQNAIKVDLEKADEMYRKMIYVIEARDDHNCSQKYERDVSKNGRALNAVVLPSQDS
ncbi:hypothetical protein Tco_0799400 [Tanacetum coccineum]|uniref:Aminotransferase-like plant mobile domain-containing protein n=1 Tax=Tanacetum coccineum TaxID=301880 RepID=A0ABQ4ZR84_9ASTR